MTSQKNAHGLVEWNHGNWRGVFCSVAQIMATPERRLQRLHGDYFLLQDDRYYVGQSGHAFSRIRSHGPSLPAGWAFVIIYHHHLSLDELHALEYTLNQIFQFAGFDHTGGTQPIPNMTAAFLELCVDMINHVFIDDPQKALITRFGKAKHRIIAAAKIVRSSYQHLLTLK